MDLEKYYDIYDISDIDFSEAMLGYSEVEFEDPDSLRVLKILAARFQTLRRIFFCSLMALDASGEESDLYRWQSAVDEIRALGKITSEAEERLSRILNEEESEFCNIGYLDVLIVLRFPGSCYTENASHSKS